MSLPIEVGEVRTIAGGRTRHPALGETFDRWQSRCNLALSVGQSQPKTGTHNLGRKQTTGTPWSSGGESESRKLLGRACDAVMAEDVGGRPGWTASPI
jgi:hypothetical protein